jgi:hypothetical protein
MADTSYVPGDILVRKFMISSDRGTIDLKTGFVSASIYESIFTPGMMADIKILDDEDKLGTIKIVGDEIVEMSFEVPGGITTSYKFSMHTMENVNMAGGSLNAKMYLIKLASKEALNAKTNFVQKSFNTQISGIVESIHKDYLKSEKEIEVEETKGKQKIVFPHYNPYKAIDMVRRRAISNENTSSAFVYFETRSPEEQKFRFTTIEGLFKQEPIREFKQQDTVGHTIYNEAVDNIIALEIPHQFNVIDRIKVGGKRIVKSFDSRTHEYNEEKRTVSDTEQKTGGTGSYISSREKTEYSEDPKINPTSFITKDWSQRPVTHIPEKTIEQQQYISTLMQNAIKMRVHGDFALVPGAVIKANIPNKQTTTSNRDNDPLITGTFLISRIHHQINELGMNPRYTCVVECIKGNMEEGVS